MTGAAIARPWDQPIEGDRLRPAEGWLTVGMVVLLVESFVWSLQDAAWIPDSQGSSAHLFFLALAAIFVELVGAKAGWGRWRTHLLAALVGGLVLPYVAAITVLSARGTPADWTDLVGLYHTAGTIAFNVWADLIRDQKPFTSEFGHYHLVFGAIVWAAGMVATSAVFQRHRPFDAVVVVGILLLTNMTATANQPIWYLVVFSVAALVLLVRAHAFDEQLTWVRRRIGDPSAVAGLYIRGGASFVGVAVVGALILTWTASSAPLQGLWSDLPSRFIAISDFLQQYAPGGGAPRPVPGSGFTPTALMTGSWSPLDGTAFTAKQTAGSTTDFKWLAATYSAFDGVNHWAWGKTDATPVPATQNVLAGTIDDPGSLPARREVTFTITPGDFRENTVLSPQFVESVDQGTTVQTLGDNTFTTLQRDNGGPYTVTALVPDLLTGDGVTENRLRNTARAYPDEISATYLSEGGPNVLGPESLKIYATVKGIASANVPAGSPADNPYDFAKALEQYLQASGAFQYDPNIVDDVRSRCGGLSSVECFATIRKGYCQYYASFMAILLRHDGIPSRVASGYIPGKVLSDGTQIVPNSNSHWWVQAYFADYGWMDFDPTGSVGDPQTIVAGPRETLGPPSTGGPRNTHRPGEPDDSARPRTGGGGKTTGGSTSTGTGAGPFVVIGLLLLVALAVLALTARRRAPRIAMDPDSAWGGLGRLATRFGFGPRPAQTVYEYAGALGEAVPSMRVELETVARAKVEVAYGRQSLPLDRLRAVGDAYRRLRFAIVRRGLARWGRRRR